MLSPEKFYALARLHKELDDLAKPLRDPEALRDIVAELIRILAEGD